MSSSCEGQLHTERSKMGADTLVITLGLSIILCALLYLFSGWNFGYWKKRGICEAKSYPFLGTFPNILTQKRHFIYDVEEVYKAYKDSENFVGVLTSRNPQLLILDPECANQIYVSAFKNFHDNEFSTFANEKTDFFLANHPISLMGDKWKEFRSFIAPSISMNRLKSGYPVTKANCKRLNMFIREQIEKCGRNGINTNELCFRYTSDVTTDCTIGVQAKSLTSSPTPILNYIESIFVTNLRLIVYLFLIALFPWLRKIYKFRIFSKDLEKYFVDLIQKLTDERRAERNDRVDFINYLLQHEDKKGPRTALEMTTLVITFFTDGFMTAGNAFSHCLLCIARDTERQEILRDEILKHIEEDGYVSFENLHALPYLEACFNEGLRLFPPAIQTAKVCTAPYEFTNKNGKTLKVLPGEIMLIPAYCIHRDPKYYDEPDHFRPERFLPENGGLKSYRDRGIFYGYGNGPRTCLGMRFGLTQVKAAIVEIITNFNIKVNPKTRNDDFISTNVFFAELEGGIWLDFEPRC